MIHAPGARDVIAKALSGDKQPHECWYTQADEVLECLTAAGLVVRANDSA